MRQVDVVIVGGGPAGSTCALHLVRAGVDCVVLDRAEFPRLKLCAGWVTPEAVEDMQLEPTTYPGGFLTFDELRVHMGPLSYGLRGRQHSIRRIELDAWLLARSGVEVVKHDVRSIAVEEDGYVVDDAFRCRWLVGAGGTRCPVYRQLFKQTHIRPDNLQAAVLEEEFPYPAADATCHLWFFERGLPGYSWYVPKADGHLNVGVGGMSTKLAGRRQSIKTHWQRLTSGLESKGMVSGHEWEAGGYTYFCRPPAETLRSGNAFLCGDSAGLATRDMFEGIGPAIRSGIRAAQAIAGGRAYDLDDVSPYTCPPGLLRRALEFMFVTRRG